MELMCLHFLAPFVLDIYDGRLQYNFYVSDFINENILKYLYKHCEKKNNNHAYLQKIYSKLLATHFGIELPIEKL